MQLRFQEFDDFIVFFKPFGIRMHQVDEGQFGFVETLSQKLEKPLFIVHRLDKATSGIVLMAKTKEAAAELTQLFEQQKIKKTYYFLTDRLTEEKSFNVKTFIHKVQNQFVNDPTQAANSETDLEFVDKVGKFQLWKARPHSGKPHQIRLHAENKSIPVLGDTDHNGSPWFRLNLHASELEFEFKNKKFHFTSELPPSFLNEVSEIEGLFADSFFNKKQLFAFSLNECLRLIHTEYPNLRADLLGARLWVYDYSPKGLNESDRASIQQFGQREGLEVLIRHMLDRGQGVGGLEQSTLQATTSSATWTADEESVHYLFRSDSGFSPGLFLDQRENRKWVRTQVKNKTALNLFSYTSGFSVIAALGGAKAVTTVDTSKKFLEWSKENFKLNQLDPAKYEFFAQDCLLFLSGSKKRNRKWDFIICDPPSFGRSKDSVWKIERNIGELAQLLWECLSPKGQILFTCNYEEWSRSELIKQFSKKLPKNQYMIDRMPLLSLDYGETDELKGLLKGFTLRKTN